MIAKVQKWGNSLALRIPKALAEDVQIEDGAKVDLSVKDGRLVIAPVKKVRYNLDELLAGVTRENLHGEVEMRGPAGKEYW